MFLDLNATHDRETVMRALQAWAADRGRRAGELQPLAPMLSLKVREEGERAKRIRQQISEGA